MADYHATADVPVPSKAELLRALRESRDEVVKLVGSLPAARFEEGLGIRRKLAQANPTSAQAQRDVSIDLNKLGGVAVEAGDLADARVRFEEGLGIDRKLAQGVVCLEYGTAPVFVAMPHQNACLSRRMEGGRDPDNSNGTLSVYESDRGHNSLAVVKGTHPGGFAPK